MSTFLQKLGRPFVASAFRRLADHFQAGAWEWFTETGIVAPSRTIAQVLLLAEKGPLGITEIAAELGQSHPTIIDWTRQLEAVQLVELSPGRKDRRRTIVALTNAGHEQARRIGAVQVTIESAYDQLCAEVSADVFDALLRLEAACAQKSMLERLRAAASMKAGQHRARE